MGIRLVDIGTTGGSWAPLFRRVEDPNGKFNHGNGAYGTFGYRKSGHLTQLWEDNSFKPIRDSFEDYNDFFDTFSSASYSHPLVQEVDSLYENWLYNRSGGNLQNAVKINYFGNDKQPITHTPKGQISGLEYMSKMGVNSNNFHPTTVESYDPTPYIKNLTVPTEFIEEDFLNDANNFQIDNENSIDLNTEALNNLRNKINEREFLSNVLLSNDLPYFQRIK